VKISDKYPLVALIDTAIAKRKAEERKYLGMSEIGEPCHRKLYYGFYLGKKDMKPRVRRIMDFGHMIEDYVIALLRESGLTVHDRDENGNQFRAYEFEGKFSGGMDGVVEGLIESDKPHVLEIKSANKDRFKAFVKDGVKKTEIKYWAQIQCYMKYFNLEKGLFVILCKDDCELYYERCDYDERFANEMEQKAWNIIYNGKIVPDRAYKKTDYHCKWCDYQEECWKQ
jgi:hypothetical protein